jgi:hypothetical protein
MSTRFWIASISDAYGPAESTFRRLVLQERVFAVLPNRPASSNMSLGDLICFYLKGEGIAGYAELASHPTIKKEPRVPYTEKYTCVFELRNPIECERPGFDFHDKEQRESLDAMRGKRLTSWAWFVRTPHEITERDFRLLTNKVKHCLDVATNNGRVS